MLDFYNYQYIHKKYSIAPSSRSSRVIDNIDELEAELLQKWDFYFSDVFAKAVNIKNGKDLDFSYINKEVVDGKHLGLDDLIGFFKENKREKRFVY